MKLSLSLSRLGSWIYRQLIAGGTLAVRFIIAISLIVGGYWAYAVYTNPLPTIPSGGMLTSSWVQNLVDTVNTLTSEITVSNGTVGINNVNPQANLDVGGSIRFGGRTITHITVCNNGWKDASNDGNGNSHYYDWTTGDCDNGFPTGSCLGMMNHGEVDGDDQDWGVFAAGETYNSNPSIGFTHTYPNGGIHFWTNLSYTLGGTYLKATYFCSQ